MNADEKNTAIEEIAAAIAHEVKNPLTMINANLDILQADDGRISTADNYAMMRRELKKINNIMMDFIHITQNNDCEKDIIYLMDILQNVLESIKPALPNIVVKICCPDNDLAIFGHENSIKILLNNIIKNALEAMDFSGKLEIEMLRQENNALMNISDNGKGLSSEIADDIFNKYFTTKCGGSGLGLSICRKIVKDHGGNMSLSRRTEGGCTASVTIPATFN